MSTNTKITVSDLRMIIRETLEEAGATKTSPSSLMKQITSALSSLGFTVKSREKNSGSSKVWLDAKKQSKSKNPWVTQSPIGVDDIIEVLSAAGLETSIGSEHSATILRGSGFEIKVPDEGEKYNMGADLFVKVFAGKNADLEKSGFDTTDLSFGESVTHRVSEASKKLSATSLSDLSSSLKSLGYAVPEKEKKQSSIRSRSISKPGKSSYESVEKEYMKAVKEFASDYDPTSFEDVDPSDVATEAANGFFYCFPEWKTWASVLKITKADIKSAVSEMIYEKMLSS